MEKYKEAKQLVTENKFESAIESYKESFNNEVLNENEKIDCLTQIIKLQKLLNKKEDSSKIENDLADFLINRRDYSSASEVLKKLILKTASFNNYKKLVDTLVSDGQLEEAEIYTLKALRYLYRTKNYSKILLMVGMINSYFPLNNKIQMYKILALVNLGDLNKLEQESIPNQEILFESLVGAPFNHWRNSRIYTQSVLNNCLSDRNYTLNKLAIKLLLEAVLIGKDIDVNSMEKILKFFIKNERKTASRMICNYCEQKGIPLDEKITYKIDSLPEDDEIETNFDMGEDLLEEKVIDRSEVSKIIENIDLLKSMGEEEEVDVLLLKLKRVDPENPLLIKQSGTKLKLKRIEIDDLERKWDSFFKNKNEEKNNLHSIAKTTLRTLSDEDLLKSYKDLVYCFNSMEIFEASIETLKRVEGLFRETDKALDLTYQYLLVKTLIFKKEYYKAYDIVTQINGSEPLVGEKRVEFLYLQGEIARKLGRTKDAIKSYLLVRQLHPNYRMVNQRLNNFG